MLESLFRETISVNLKFNKEKEYSFIYLNKIRMSNDTDFENPFYIYTSPQTK